MRDIISLVCVGIIVVMQAVRLVLLRVLRRQAEEYKRAETPIFNRYYTKEKS